MARALAGVMPNIGGPKQPRRLLLPSVVYSVILYGAPIWANAICSNPSYGATCRMACRIIALRVTCAYRTVSDIALSVVAGLPPLYLMACERAEVYREGVIREEADFGVETDSPGRLWRSGSTDAILQTKVGGPIALSHVFWSGRRGDTNS